MPKLKIDGKEIVVEPGTSILQAAEQLGIEIPRFCYHDRLSVAGNCRMCLVEVEGAPKPVASCTMPCGDDMSVKTGSEQAKAARKGVMEFLLINHPLDCPICDQGGECDLQDQAVAYGYDRSRYHEEKRATKNKELGPLINTVMTRCIHCTRCIRLATEVAGIDDLGALNRGNDLEIGTYVEKTINTEMSGNLVDVCPVGALTSKPHMYKARPWEYRKTESIDVMDAVGSNIRIDARGGEVMRILPRLHEDVNEEWIADKTRYVYDGLLKRRLDKPWVKKNGKLKPATWEEAFTAIEKNLDGVDGSEMAALAGDLCDVESMLSLKDLMGKLGSANLDCRQDGAVFDTSNRNGYVFNSGIAGIEESDLILLVGTNPRHEAPLVDARIRKQQKQARIKIGFVGEECNLTYPVMNLGNDLKVLEDLSKGKGDFAKLFKKAEKPMIIVGAHVFSRPDGEALQALTREIAEYYKINKPEWNGYNVLHHAAARVGGLDIDFLPLDKKGLATNDILKAATKGKMKFLYLLGADELPLDQMEKLHKDCFVVYQGSHGDIGAHHADVILPGCAYTEKHGTYVNTEGRVQLARQAVFAPGEAKEDWKIIRALSEVLGHTLPYDSLAQVRKRMKEVNPVFMAQDELVPTKWGKFGKAGKVDKTKKLDLVVENYYMTDPISRASENMANCTAAFVETDEKPKTKSKKKKVA